jgi:glycosyltransferase involved in cell wall biosynthesis
LSVSARHASSVSTLLVDARPVDHPTARQRGIGRYVTGLLAGLRDIGAPVIALYGKDAEADVLTDAVPGLTLRRWSPQVVRDHAVDGTWYLATQLMLHPIPLDPIPRCITDARLPVAAVMYDVIPFRYPGVYLTEPNARLQAGLRAPLARTVDALLAISDFAAVTAAEELRFPIERIGMIGAGVDAKFSPPLGEPRERARRVLPASVARYVVTVAGGDDHKNTQGLLRAWTEVDCVLGDSHHLVIAGAHTPAVLQRWRGWAADAGILDRVVFTGRLDDDELVAVLQGAELAVTPSLEEGFGLPVLEAAACGVAAIASNVSSLPEVLGEPAAGFDPYFPQAIADAIVKALSDHAHRSVLLAAGRRAVERWTWSNVAASTLDALAAAGPRWPQLVRRPAARLAIAGVFDAGIVDGGVFDGAVVDGAGGHVDASTALVAAINEQLVIGLRASGRDVTSVVDNAGSPEPTRSAADRWPVRAVGRFVKPWDFDHIVAVLGAAPDHVATSAMARVVPCHLWVHDDALLGVRLGANLQALEIARSVIVESAGAAELVRRAAERLCPILVMPARTGPLDLVAELARWLDDVDDLDPSTVRQVASAVASPDP